MSTTWWVHDYGTEAETVEKGTKDINRAHGNNNDYAFVYVKGYEDGDRQGKEIVQLTFNRKLQEIKINYEALDELE